MTGFVEPHPDLITSNPGGSNDPLGESVLNLSQSWLRVFEPNDIRLVIGRHQDPYRELLIDVAQADAVPIHRRVSGGGAVVLAPGMVVVALRLQNNQFGTTCYLDRVNAALVPSLADLGIHVSCRGYGDLVVNEPDGSERKVLGASLRQTAKLVIYLGVLLVSDAIPLMERYLAMPSREPSYRGGRGHSAFCTHLGHFGVTSAQVRNQLQRELAVRLASSALHSIPE